MGDTGRLSTEKGVWHLGQMASSQNTQHGLSGTQISSCLHHFLLGGHDQTSRSGLLQDWVRTHPQCWERNPGAWLKFCSGGSVWRGPWWPGAQAACTVSSSQPEHCSLPAYSWGCACCAFIPTAQALSPAWHHLGVAALSWRLSSSMLMQRWPCSGAPAAHMGDLDGATATSSLFVSLLSAFQNKEKVHWSSGQGWESFAGSVGTAPPGSQHP